MTTVGIILAGGKGVRFGAQGYNKTSELFAGKPLIRYGTELFEGVTDLNIVVIGAFGESVKTALAGSRNVEFALQKRRLGTGHALKIAIEKIIQLDIQPEYILLGYGDAMMCYRRQVVRELIKAVTEEQVGVSLVTVSKNKPDEMRWGRIIKNKAGDVIRIAEQKDATLEERKIKELNAGFYCFKYDFAKQAVYQIKKSPMSGEYYATDLIQLAVEAGLRVIPIKVPFSQVGYGANTKEELNKNYELE